mgnify:FL=1
MVELKPREHVNQYKNTPEHKFATVFYRHLTDDKFSTKYNGEIIVQIPKIIIPTVKIIRDTRNAHQIEVELCAVKSSTIIEYWDSQNNLEGEVQASFGEASYLWGIATSEENEAIDPDLRRRVPQLEDALGFSFIPGRLFKQLLKENADLYYAVYFDSDNSPGEVITFDEIQDGLDRTRRAGEEYQRQEEQGMLDLERKLRARGVVR